MAMSLRTSLIPSCQHLFGYCVPRAGSGVIGGHVGEREKSSSLLNATVFLLTAGGLFCYILMATVTAI